MLGTAPNVRTGWQRQGPRLSEPNTQERKGTIVVNNATSQTTKARKETARGNATETLCYIESSGQAPSSR